ncbi:MAG: SMP-30/gluconolactonase/LRE family protein [Dehalococcoidia bacterium]|nr:SMP-30/gluconolactonase/LRE family protein [Dehalococcoidia bacterium]
MPARVVAKELGFTEGPVWTRDGRLLVTSISHGVVYEAGSGKPRVVAETKGGPNGMAEGGDRALYVTQNGGVYGLGERTPEQAAPGIQRIIGSEVTYLTQGLDAPNDCCLGPDGRLYFTDPRGPANADNRAPGRVYVMEIGGEPQLLAEGPAFTNGIAFGPDASELYVAETFRQRVLLYEVRGGGSSLGEPREFCRTDPGFPDGMCFDEQGRLYVAATMAHEVHVFDGEGQRIEQLPCGDESMPTNCCFGGPAGRTLFVTDARGERVLAFEREAAGLPLFPFR